MRALAVFPLSLLLLAAPALAQVQVNAPAWSPGGGAVPIVPGDPLGRTPNPEKNPQPGKARSHLHPGDAQRRQDERDAADVLAAQQSVDAETARSLQRTAREIQNQQFSDQIQSQMAERDRSVLQLQLTQPRPNFTSPPLFPLPAR